MYDNISHQSQQITYLPFHSKNFWDNFYKNQFQDNNTTINWYFDLTKFHTNEFSLKNLSKEDEILIVGSGVSSTLDFFENNGYENIAIFDFSEELVKFLTEKYNKEWDIQSYDITEIGSNFPNEFNIIIDKGCLDCILSDPKNGEAKYITALTNLLLSLSENDGILYYFSNAKLEERINLFYNVPKIKYKVTTIDMNETMKEEYKEFNPSDNMYYLYEITKSQ